MTFKVSNSKLRTWRHCKRQYHYKYIEKLKKRVKSSPLIRGTIIHSMIEAHIEGRDPWKELNKAAIEYNKLFQEEKEYYGDLIGEIKMIMLGYFKFYEKDPIKYTKLKGKSSEHYFEMPLIKDIVLVGYIDSYGSTKDRLNWLVEHKSHKQIPEGDLKYSDIQSAIYTTACESIGLPKPDGVAWNYIKASPPATPEVLKNGELSRRKNMDSTWDVYLEAIKANKLDPKDYADMKEQLKDKEKNFYVRKYLPVNAHIIEEIMEDAKATASEVKLRSGKVKTRNIDRHCEWCDYYPICQAELRGLDADFIRESNFIKDEGNGKRF